ncbi:MAG: nuclear transport factor 2 family protein [Ignavibacteriaceae bacterium]|nr:nuclear transport factor 2 family protein [Ignavibacteriaceae bacterium]
MLKLLVTISLFLLTGYAQVIEKTYQEIDYQIEKWHYSAANADFAGYFSFLDDDAIFIGTDASELWKKKEFMDFAKPYFDRGTAWDFKKISRNIYYEGNFAWFDEYLDTWMGVCAGSGVLMKTNKGWKLKHYQLSVTVPNDIITDFIDLVKKFNQKE